MYKELSSSEVFLAKINRDNSGDTLLDSACVPICIILCSFASFVKSCLDAFSFKKEVPLNNLILI